MKKAVFSLSARTGALLLCLLVLAGLLATPALAESAPEASEATSQADEGEDEKAGEAPETPPPAEAGGESMFSPSFEIEAAAAYLVNEDSGLVVYEKNADTPLVAASLVKLMTSILVMEHIDDIDNTRITMEGWVNEWLYGMNASTADIRAGETLSVRELLYAMLLPSANEAALVVAGYISGGDVAYFCELMNEKAKALGCTNTTFADPNGLSEGNTTTAHDMYLILREFSSYQVLQEICQTDTYEVEQHEQHAAPYNIFTTNRLIVTSSPYYSSYPVAGQAIKAAKTGSLGEWQNFACMAEYEGLTYYSVVLHSPYEADEIAPTIDTYSYRPALCETGRLLAWAYDRFTLRAALDTTQAITEIRVLYSTEDDAVKLLPLDDLKTLLPVDTDDSAIRKTFDLPESVEAPVRQGDEIGSVTLSVAGQVIGTSKLIAAKDVERNNTLYQIEQLKGFFGTTAFKVLVGVAIALIVIYTVVAVILNRRKKRYYNPYMDNRRRR